MRVDLIHHRNRQRHGHTIERVARLNYDSANSMPGSFNVRVVELKRPPPAPPPHESRSNLRGRTLGFDFSASLRQRSNPAAL